MGFHVKPMIYKYLQEMRGLAESFDAVVKPPARCVLRGCRIKYGQPSYGFGDPAHLGGTGSAVMKTFGNLGGTVSPVAFGLSEKYLESWTAPSLIAAILCLLSVVLWMRIDPEQNPFPGAGCQDANQ